MNCSKEEATYIWVYTIIVSTKVSKYEVTLPRGYWHKVTHHTHTLGFHFLPLLLFDFLLKPFPTEILQHMYFLH